jgi:hypothetical protein
MDKAGAVAIFELAPHTLGPLTREEAGGRAATRAPRGRVDPTPNAPLLIRLVRTPYGLATGRARREDLAPRGLASTPRARLEHRPPTSEALADAAFGRGPVSRGVRAIPYRRPVGVTLVPRPRRYPEDP